MNRIVTAAVAALFVLGLTAPVVLADRDDDRRAERDERRDERQEKFEERREKMEKAREKMKDRGHRERATFLITINAQGIDQDNATWTILGEGTAIAKSKMVAADDEEEEAAQASSDAAELKAIHGFAKLNVSLKNSTGAIVKEGVIKVRFIAHQNETGDWSWKMVSVSKTPRGLPKIFLRGDNVTLGDGVAALEGQGFALVKAQKDDDSFKHLRLRLDADVHLAKL
jgi:hypothetical protein